jgi:hypothetical protein
MATIKRNPHGPQMKPGQIISVQTAVQTPELEDGPMPSQGIQMTQVEQPMLHQPNQAIRMVNGGHLFWTPLDFHKESPNEEQGKPWSYVCEEREMKIAVNLRSDRGRIGQGNEWVLFRMGELIARSTNLKELFELAESK